MIHVIWSRGDWFLFAEIESPIETAAASPPHCFVISAPSRIGFLERKGEKKEVDKKPPSPSAPSFL